MALVFAPHPDDEVIIGGLPLRHLPALRCHVVETEYWGAMAAPNLMVESSPAGVG